MPPSALLLTILSPFILSAMADSAPSTLPQVDFSRMGSVGLGGSFFGLDWYSPSSSSTPPFSSDGDTVFVRSSDGRHRPLGSTNPGGLVNALCWSSSSDANGTLYIGGSFTSLSSVTSSNIVAYSLSSSTFHAVPGVSGPVNTLYCDNARDQVWVGGSFAAPSEHVALWSTGSSSWAPVPFGGLNGPVETISSNGSSVLFGGHFTINNSSKNTSGNITSVPSAPENTSTIGNSGYLTPVSLPSSSSNYGNLTISAGPGTSQQQYSDPDVLLCPGEGVWLAQDETVSNVDVLSYAWVRATGARVSNGLVEGRGATTFCITSLPDNTQLNMTYTDASGKNATCWEHCPLSTDPTVSAQDFIFTLGARNLTGLQIQLKTWIGSGAGLSSVQLLSEGSYSSAVSSPSVCSGDTSSVQRSGEWTVATTGTPLPATTSYYLTSTVPTSNPTYPSVTFYPKVTSSGHYDIYIVVPGCGDLGDCDGRTTVDVEVFPVLGGLGWTSTISEQVRADTRTLVYSGPVDASTDGFTPTVSLALAKSSAGVSGDNYVVVAEAVELVLTGVTGGSARTSGQAINGTVVSNSTSQVAFGVFEWTTDATLSNATETALSQLGFALEAAYGSPTWTVNTIAMLGGTAFVGGNFTSPDNYSNVISVNASGKVTALASQGLIGVVYAAAVVGESVYFGGDFSSTTSGGVALNHLAQYDPKGTWSAIGGVNGVVTGLVPLSSSQLVVVGKFSHVVTDGTTTRTGGYAVWDTMKSTWSSGAVFGNVSAAAISPSSDTFLAGRVSGASSNPVDGVAMLSSEEGTATITPLKNANLGSTGAVPAPSPVRRSFSAHRSHSWLARVTHALRPRAPTAPPIKSRPAPAPAVLAGVFWTNTSAPGKPTVTILGGNLSSSAMVLYASERVSDVPVQGVVRALEVIGNDVYVGGTDLEVPGTNPGLAVYHLGSKSWAAGGIPSLNPASGGTLTVAAIRARPETDTVVVAGNFASAGSLSCAAVCLWDRTNAQWSTPGTGLTSGEVRAMDFAGETYDTVVVAGSFVMSDGTVAYVASYSFANSTWTALGDLPGPALAVALDNKNATNVFAAGYATADAAPYLQRWDGQTWTAQNQSLLPGSVVQQLAFVPMATEHTAVGSIENDRMLMVTGDLSLSTGEVTSALYDGARWYPYLVASGGGGGGQLFWSSSSFSFNVRHHLAKGLVVLVAIAIATGLILLFILLALLIAYLTRRSERRQVPPDTYDKDSDVSSTHQHVFNNVQAALEQSLIGGSATAAIAAARRSDASHYDEAAEESDEDDGRETTMRYNFEGEELQPGELSMRAGSRVVILDDVQSDEWWYARDPATGREGVVPATYVW